MPTCTQSQMVCDNPTPHWHSCPMSRIDGCHATCDCCEVCKAGCRANEQQITNLEEEG